MCPLLRKKNVKEVSNSISINLVAVIKLYVKMDFFVGIGPN